MFFKGVTVSKLLIIRDAARKPAIDAALPVGWNVMAVGDKISPSVQGPYEEMICACELYTTPDWQWYHTVIKHLMKDKTKQPLWTN